MTKDEEALLQLLQTFEVIERIRDLRSIPITIVDRQGRSPGPSIVIPSSMNEAIRLGSEHLLKHADALEAFGMGSFGVVMRLMKEVKPTGTVVKFVHRQYSRRTALREICGDGAAMHMSSTPFTFSFLIIDFKFLPTA